MKQKMKEKIAKSSPKRKELPSHDKTETSNKVFKVKNDKAKSDPKIVTVTNLVNFEILMNNISISSFDKLMIEMCTSNEMIENVKILDCFACCKQYNYNNNMTSYNKCYYNDINNCNKNICDDCFYYGIKHICDACAVSLTTQKIDVERIEWKVNREVTCKYLNPNYSKISPKIPALVIISNVSEIIDNNNNIKLLILVPNKSYDIRNKDIHIKAIDFEISSSKTIRIGIKRLLICGWVFCGIPINERYFKKISEYCVTTRYLVTRYKENNN